MTQICYDADRILAFISRCREAGIDVPVIPGVKPLSTLRQLTLLPGNLRHRNCPKHCAAKSGRMPTAPKRSAASAWSGPSTSAAG